MGWLKADILTVAGLSHKHTRSLSPVLMLLQLMVKGWGELGTDFSSTAEPLMESLLMVILSESE